MTFVTTRQRRSKLLFALAAPKVDNSFSAVATKAAEPSDDYPCQLELQVVLLQTVGADPIATLLRRGWGRSSARTKRNRFARNYSKFYSKSIKINGKLMENSFSAALRKRQSRS